jgi:diguanylate cyclase (GGDEF)-like protein
MRLHPEVASAAIYRPRASAPSASFGRAGGRTELSLVRRSLRSGRPASAEARERGRHAEALVTSLREGGRRTGSLALTYDLRPAHAALGRRNRSVLLVLCALLTCFTAFTALVLRRGIFRPLERLRLATQAVGRGDLATRLDWRRRDELGQLAHDFDQMAGELEENNRRLEELAHRDPLTGLANHRRFQEALGKELELARTSGRPLAVVMVDIDDFKRINDAHGHPFGDELLARSAEGLRAAMRGLGVAARVAGDQFGIILPDADGARALALAEGARAAVRGAASGKVLASCSAGIACYPEDARNASALTQLADGALLWAKESGRGRTRRYDPEQVFVVTDEQRDDFSELIARPNAVRPVYQPIVSLASGELAGYEALARFDSKPGLPPSWWFSQAHRFGLGPALEAEAVRASLATAGRPADAFLSVNLSPTALVSEEAFAHLPHDLSGVVIEITEGEQVLDVPALQRHLDPLRARGARIAVDDAGEGYAGLQQVMRMRADIIKLDRALVSDVHRDPAKIALIGSLVQFGRSTGAAICAEGIEHLDELRVLVHLGVAYGQGWVLARPGEGWGGVSEEAAALCRNLGGEQDKVVTLEALRRPA